MSNQEENLQLQTAEELEHHLVMGEALKRLKENPDFQRVILDGYLKNKVMSSVSLLAVPAIKKSGERGDIMEDLVASSNLNYYFLQIENFYKGAVDPILSDAEEEELKGNN